MTDHKGLPVHGYEAEQSQRRIDAVNEGKILEEKVLRYIDQLQAQGPAVNQRFVATGLTDIQKGFMMLFRGVFQPDGSRISLPSHDLIENAARAAHEAIRVIQVEHNEPNVASPWDEAPQDIKDSCYIGIQRVIDNPEITSEELHDSWIETKLSQGWQYGEVRNEELKLHPCLVPYSELPSFQRLKDALFRNTVKAVLGL